MLAHFSLNSSHFLSVRWSLVWFTIIVPGMVTTFLGQTNQNGAGTFADGVGNSAGMNTPNGLTIDSTGSSLLFADMDNLRIRKSNSAG